MLLVALRKESVDRNDTMQVIIIEVDTVALRKESVDRNFITALAVLLMYRSLSARRAWIEIVITAMTSQISVSLSARRAWIEMLNAGCLPRDADVALRKESVDRNDAMQVIVIVMDVALRKESVDRNERPTT